MSDGPRATGDVAIRVRGLVKRFGSQTIFDGLALDVHAGEVLGLVGASGQGKSVLLRTLAGLEPYEAGQIAFGAGARGDGTAAPTALGILFQDGALFGALTVLENIEVPLREQSNLPPSLRRDLAMMKLRLVGLPDDAAHKPPSALSGGMRKRAGLARALALDPRILFLDEPTAGLDPISAASFDDLIVTLQRA
ncbi:MAG: ATP-binding cassette domain-containing protein, partial [Pseudomonadota bacterium]